MLVAISGVFVYGIYLKASGPSDRAVDAPARPASQSPTAPTPPSRPAGAPSEASPAPDAGIETQTARSAAAGDEALGAAPQPPAELPPVIPEATTASTLGVPGPAGGSPPPSRLATAPVAPRASAPPAPAPSPSAPQTGSAPESGVSQPPPGTRAGASAATAPPPAAPPVPRTSVPAPRPASSTPRAGVPGVTARHEEPPVTLAPAAPAGSPLPVPAETPEDGASRVSASPRGTAPAVALRKAREQFGAGRYKDAARSWNDWAVRAPAGSWTVQIAAIRLDKTASVARLDGIAGREGAFVLPAGSLPGGLSPVCVGIYPSEEAARRAAAAIAPYPGSTSRPIPKPLSSLSH